jgi:hypothetical protein
MPFTAQQVVTNPLVCRFGLSPETYEESGMSVQTFQEDRSATRSHQERKAPRHGEEAV